MTARPPAAFPTFRLDQFQPPSPEEWLFLTGWAGEPFQLRRRETIRREGDPAAAIYLLHEGWVASSTVCNDGNRQIVTLHLPGDVMGLSSLPLAQAADTLMALTPITASRVPVQALGRMFVERPRLAAILFLHAQLEQLNLADRIASIGRSSAEGRLAAFLLYLGRRIWLANPCSQDSFAFPLTQEEVADMLGLTAVHVNRTFRALEERGLISRAGHQVRVRNVSGLAALAGLTERTVAAQQDWLPPA